VALRVIAALALVSSLASAEPTTLRVASAAPEGTTWARVFRAMARDVERDGRGEIATKWYLGGIAGNELQMLDRLRKGQLDIVMSGGMLCMKLSPSMRALRLLGLFQSREEAEYVLGRLRPTIDAELAHSGFRNMADMGVGSDMIASRAPITSLAALKRARLWFWDLDDPLRAQLAALGVPGVGLGVEDAARAYDAQRTDGFIAAPMAMLAFQWSAQARYLSDLRVAYLPACMVMTQRAWDSLSLDGQRALSTATARLQARLEELSRAEDAQLVGALFAHQGMTTVPAGAAFTSEFLEAAHAAREAVRDKIIPGGLVDRVIGWVADYRAEYGSTPSRPR
jgi:TRAP-type transport system periplasmic protein